MLDNEGYTCILGDSNECNKWLITDRYSKIVDGEMCYPSYEEARHRADEMNEDVIARRLADMIAKR